MARDLTQHGHRVVGVDSSPTLISFARDANPDIEFVVADAAALPSPDDEFDLVVAYMSLMDIDDLSGAVRETARVLSPRGCFLLFDRPPDQLCRAFEGDTSASPFVIEASYLGERRYTDFLERDGLEMTFHSVHRPLETYARALEASGFALETIRKPPTTAHVEREERAARWRRIPCFLYGRARKT